MVLRRSLVACGTASGLLGYYLLELDSGHIVEVFHNADSRALSRVAD